MTNEEKAKEIAERNYCLPCNQKYCIEELLEMAEWKDKQFKGYLEKKIKDCDDIAIRKAWFGDDWKKYDCFISVYKQIIKELFGEEEKVSTEDNDE